MEIIYYIFFFILGTILGSFYHVVGTRLSENKSILSPRRSYCPYCNHPLSWYELIPLVSYLWQKGRCNHCKKKISFSYFLIELITGGLFTLCYYSFGLSLDGVIAILLVSFFVIVLVSDINYLVIPDEVTFLVSILLIILNYLKLGLKGSIFQLGSAISLFIFMYLLMLLGNFLFKKESLGGGDIKLMFVVGLVLHPLLGFAVIFLASFIALPVSIFLYLLNEEKVIPFGPFLLIAMLFLYFMKIDIPMLLYFLINLL